MNEMTYLEEPMSQEEEIVEDPKNEPEQREDDPLMESSPDAQSEIPTEPPAEVASALEGLSSFEKVKKAIDIMNKAIAMTPCNFREFWETRKWVMPFLKDIQQPNEKAELWNEISHLTQEVRRQKEVILKESAFAQEQIEIAITALEKELEELATVQQPQVGLELPAGLLELHQKFYTQSQGELNLLNAYAMRINSLRKELMRTSLKVKAKSHLFDRLSKAGDKIFPKRKTLIQGVSDSFVKDVTEYCDELRDIRRAKKKLMEVRDEIKELQRIAKLLTLNTFAFNSTRMMLSELWDKVKQAERERKKEVAVLKADSEKQLDELKVELETIKKAHEEGASNRQTEHLLTELMKKARIQKLDRQHVAQLKDAAQPLKDTIEQKINEEATRRQEEEVRKENERKEKVDACFAKIEELLKDQSTDLKALEADVAAVKEDFNALQLSRKEKLDGERMIKQLHLFFIDRKEKAILNLSEDDKATIDSLKQVLASRQERRREIKERIESLRKTRGNSGLDFEQALNLDALITEEREALDDINMKIEEVQKQIDLIKSKS